MQHLISSLITVTLLLIITSCREKNDVIAPVMPSVADIEHNPIEAVVNGTAVSAVDFGCSPVLGVPPEITSFDVFYEEIDLAVSPSGSTNPWHGWGRVSWNLGGGQIQASGGAPKDLI